MLGSAMPRCLSVNQRVEICSTWYTGHSEHISNSGLLKKVWRNHAIMIMANIVYTNTYCTYLLSSKYLTCVELTNFKLTKNPQGWCHYYYKFTNQENKGFSN